MGENNYKGNLVSVIIPCYNHGHFLPEAIASVLAQSYGPIEIVVVDDGSTDNTRQVAGRYPEVKYVYKENAGLSAARNTGIEKSTGDFLVFLDADDWLYKDAVETNLQFFLKNPEFAFVSGSYDRFLVAENIYQEEIVSLTLDPYWHLLHGNFIGAPAVAMYQRWVFEKFRFDICLKACEDYDMYLNIFREYKVLHHSHKVAAYRTHTSNMSSNIPLMLASALKVLKRQKARLRTADEKRAYTNGKNLWKEYYCQALLKKIITNKSKTNISSLFFLLKHRPNWALKYITGYLFDSNKNKRLSDNIYP
jgi:glycosyltransferase involved in cell wall biosynthesis